MAGRPPKPAHLKLISGTSRADRKQVKSIAIPVIVQAPAPPDWLPNSHAIKEWNRLVEILMANRLLTEAGLGTLAMLCALHGRLVQCWAAGEAPSASLIATHRAMGSDFGLSPAALGKVHPGGSANGSNKFAKNGKRL